MHRTASPRAEPMAPIYAVQTDPRQRRRTTLSSTRRKTAPSVAATKLAAVDTEDAEPRQDEAADERPEDADHDVAYEAEAMPSEERH